MSCPVCESTQLIPDEATGQLICSECGTATGVYHGLTQSQVYEEPRGLRVVGKVEQSSYDLSSSSQPLVSSTQLSSDLFEVCPPLQAGIIEAGMEAIVNKSLLGGFSQTRNDRNAYQYPEEEDSILGDELWQLPGKLEKEQEKRDCRPWRLSEPFTFIMRRQTESLAQELNLTTERKQRLCDNVWRIWLNYLAVTGELGNEAWLHAVVSLTKSTRTVLRERTKYGGSTSHLTLHYAKRRLNDSGLTNDEWIGVQSRVGQFQWVGWSTLYEPNEGREVVDVAHATPGKPSEIPEPLNEQNGEKRRHSLASSSSSSSDLSDSEDTSSSSIDNSVNQPATPNQATSSNQLSTCQSSEIQHRQTNCHDNASILSDAIPPSVHSVDDMCDLVVDHLDPDQDTDHKPNITKLKKHIARNLLQKNTWRRLLWRGQLEGQLNTQALLEHNLAVLFIACLSIIPGREVVNPLVKISKSSRYKHPVALTKLLTLTDLYELCSDRRLPFISVSSCLPPDLFVIHDRALFGLFRRNRPPRMDHLAHAAVQMLHLTGLHQLPKFPLAWLMHRHIIVLGLPKCTHIVAELLVECLRNRARILSNRFRGHLNYWIHWLRVLRPEIFAMAAVVIVLRIIFKFDDTSEFYLSRIAKILQTIPDKMVYGTSSASTSQPDPPFVWTSWTSYIESRFQSRTKHDHLDVQPNSRKADHSASLLKTATSASQLAGLETAKDFLGLSEFRIGQDKGWGENTMKPTRISDITIKLAMTGPLRELTRADSDAQSTGPTNDMDLSNLDVKSLLDRYGQTNNFLGVVATKSELEGLQSPFRNSHLDFLYASQININCLINSAQNIKSEPYEIQLDLLTNWWSNLIKQRSFYHSICTGEWSTSSETKTIWKNRHRVQHNIYLPKPVEDLIRKHDDQLAWALDPASSDPDRDQNPDPAKTNHSKPDINDGQDNFVDADEGDPETDKYYSANSETYDPNYVKCSHCRKPSRSLRWLLDLCSTVCGAGNNKTLLTELECLERLLKWVAIPTCLAKSRSEVRIADIALLSMFDLNPFLPLKTGIPNSEVQNY